MLQLPAVVTFQDPEAASAEEGENEVIAASAAMLEVRMRAGFRVFMVVELSLSFAENGEEGVALIRDFSLRATEIFLSCHVRLFAAAITLPKVG